MATNTATIRLLRQAEAKPARPRCEARSATCGKPAYFVASSRTFPCKCFCDRHAEQFAKRHRIGVPTAQGAR